MPVDLSKLLVIGVSSRVLFDMTEANDVYEKQGLEAYIKYQMEHAEEALEPGPGFPLIKAILGVNKKASAKRKAEVIIMSRNNPSTSLRMFSSISQHGLDIQRAVLSGGAPLAPYIHAFDVDLFLSADGGDVQKAIDVGVAAGVIYAGYIPHQEEQLSEIRIALDADAVVFSDDAEQVFKAKGLEAFVEHETRNAKRPLPKGPFAKLLQTLSFLREDQSFEERPVRLALITARNMPAHERVIRTLLAWDIDIDEAFFMGGVEKTRILEAFKPHIYFDDQPAHCEPASKVVPTARVPYKSDSPLAQASLREPVRKDDSTSNIRLASGAGDVGLKGERDE